MPRQHQVAALACRDTYRGHIGMYRISASGFRIKLGLWLESEGFTKSELGWDLGNCGQCGWASRCKETNAGWKIAACRVWFGD